MKFLVESNETLEVIVPSIHQQFLYLCCLFMRLLQTFSDNLELAGLIAIVPDVGEETVFLEIGLVVGYELLEVF